MRRTKIVATIGPACDAPGVLRDVIAAGVDIARLNSSHGTMADLTRRLAAVRAEASAAGRVIGIMLDLPGPKLRVGEMAEGVVLADGTPADADLDARTLSISLDSLRRCPTVIAVATGEQKKAATLAAVTAGLVTHLITDSSIATYLLAASTDTGAGEVTPQISNKKD